MKNATLLAIAAAHFAGHPDTNKLHYTSDQQGFFVLTDAQSHGNTLPDKSIVTISRDEVEAVAEAKPKASKK